MRKFHLESGSWIPVERGLYRLPGYPDTLESSFVCWTLWSHNRKGQPLAVISHESALHYYGLLETAPSKITFTVPPGFRKESPHGCILRRKTLSSTEIKAVNGFSVVTPETAIRQCKEGLKRKGSFEKVTFLAKRLGMWGTETVIKRRLLNSRESSITDGNTVILMMSMEGHLESSIYNNLCRKLEELGLTPILLTPSRDSKSFIDKLDYAIKTRPLAIVFNNPRVDTFPYDYLSKMEKKLPRLLFLHKFDIPKNLRADYIISDIRDFSYQATRFLIGQGRKKILLWTYTWLYDKEDYCHTDHCQFINGYKAALAESGMDYQRLLYDYREPEKIKPEFRSLMSSMDRPDAIVSDGDFRIARNMDILRDLNLKHPEDVYLFGSYNTPWSSEHAQNFSSVSVNEEEMAAAAVDRILNGGESRTEILIKPKLIIRG